MSLMAGGAALAGGPPGPDAPPCATAAASAPSPSGDGESAANGETLQRLRDAYRREPGEAVLLKIIGIEVELGQDLPACNDLDDYHRRFEAGASAAHVIKAGELRREIDAKVSHLRILVEPADAKVSRDDRPVRPDVEECIAPGSYFIQAEAPGKKKKQKDVSLLPGERRTEALALQDLPPQPNKPMRFAGFLMMAVGAGGLVVSGGVAHVGLDPRGTDYEKGTFPLISAVTLTASGLVLGVGTFVVVTASQWGTPTADPAHKSAGLHLSIGGAPTDGGALGVIRGAF